MKSAHDAENEATVTTARREPRTVLEHLIQQRDCTYEELADEFGRTGERVPISARHLGRLARGERLMAGTNPATRRALQAMFSLPLEELLRPWSQVDVSAVPNHEDSPTGLIVTDIDRSVLTMAADRARRFTLSAAQTTAPGSSNSCTPTLRDSRSHTRNDQ